MTKASFTVFKSITSAFVILRDLFVLLDYTKRQQYRLKSSPVFRLEKLEIHVQEVHSYLSQLKPSYQRMCSKGWSELCCPFFQQGTYFKLLQSDDPLKGTVKSDMIRLFYSFIYTVISPQINWHLWDSRALFSLTGSIWRWAPTEPRSIRSYLSLWFT